MEYRKNTFIDFEEGTGRGKPPGDFYEDFPDPPAAAYRVERPERTVHRSAGQPVHRARPYAADSARPQERGGIGEYVRNVAIAAGVIGLLFGAGYCAARPARTTAGHAMKVDASRRDRAMPVQQKPVASAPSRPPINIDGRFRAYKPNSIYDDFLRGEELRFGQIDLNDDGFPEGVYGATNQEGRGAVYVTGVINGESRSLLSNAQIRKIGMEKTNGYRDMFGHGTEQLPKGGQAETIIKYVFDGEKYAESGRVVDPKRVETVARHIANTLRTDTNPDSRRRFLLDMEQIIGRHDTLTSMLAAQDIMGGRPRMPMPTGIDYENYIRVYYEETGVDLSNVDPDEVERIMFSHALDPIVMNPTEPLVLAGIFGRRLTEEFGVGEYDQHLDRIKRSGGSLSGPIEAFEKNMKRKPNKYELNDMIRLGASYSIPYDNTRDRAPEADYGVTRSWSSGGQSGETTTYRPFAPEAEQRARQANANAQQRVNENRARAQQLGSQMDAQARAAAGRAAQEAGRAVNGAGQAVNNFLNPKKDKP